MGVLFSILDGRRLRRACAIVHTRQSSLLSQIVLLLSKMAPKSPFKWENEILVPWRICTFAREAHRAFVTEPKSRSMAICGIYSGESSHLQRLARAFFTVQNSHVLTHIAICVPFMRAAKALASLRQLPQQRCVQPSAHCSNCFKYCSQRIVIKILDRTMKKVRKRPGPIMVGSEKAVIAFWTSFHGNMTIAMLRHAHFP